MSILRLNSYAEGRWFAGGGVPALLVSAMDGMPVAETTSSGLDMAALLAHARKRGGPALRASSARRRRPRGGSTSSPGTSLQARASVLVVMRWWRRRRQTR